MRTLEEVLSYFESNKITGYQLAQDLDITQPGADKILNKVSKPRKTTLRMLSEYIDKKEGKSDLNVFREESATYVTGRNIMMIPVVGQRAQAGFLVGYGDSEYLESLPKIPYEVDKEYRGKYVCFEVSGDSMDDNTADAILENDVLVCREIQRHHWSNKLHINKWDFVLVHKEMGIVVKRITKHDTQKGILTLHSLNNMYEDYEVNMNDLITIFNVVDVTRSRRR